MSKRMLGSIIYTAIAGGYDNLKSPRIGGGGLDHPRTRLAFVDNPVLCDAVDRPGWQVRQMESICMDPLMQAKRYKILAHRVLPADTGYSLWVDGKLEISDRLDVDGWAAEHLGDRDIALFRHPSRSCLYREAYVCARKLVDDWTVIARQVNGYRREGYPRDNGLAECSVILRRHTPDMSRLEEAWWTEVTNGSRRDQLSFDYVCWKLGIRYATLPGDYHESPWFRKLPHIRPRSVRPGSEQPAWARRGLV